MINDVYIGIGGNLVADGYPDLHAALEDAISDLSNSVDIVAVSPWYVTAPVPVSDQPDFLNAVVHIQTDLSPHSVLESLHAVEMRFGRVRNVRNAARKLDLDILAYGPVVIDEDKLTVPHPRISERAFVLLPWCDLAPDWCHPLLKKTIRQLAERIDLTDQKIRKYETPASL